MNSWLEHQIQHRMLFVAYVGFQSHVNCFTLFLDTALVWPKNAKNSVSVILPGAASSRIQKKKAFLT